MLLFEPGATLANKAAVLQNCNGNAILAITTREGARVHRTAINYALCKGDHAAPGESRIAAVIRTGYISGKSLSIPRSSFPERNGTHVRHRYTYAARPCYTRHIAFPHPQTLKTKSKDLINAIRLASIHR